jgi:hypothetical protein
MGWTDSDSSQPKSARNYVRLSWKSTAYAKSKSSAEEYLPGGIEKSISFPGPTFPCPFSPCFLSRRGRQGRRAEHDAAMTYGWTDLDWVRLSRTGPDSSQPKSTRNYVRLSWKSRTCAISQQERDGPGRFQSASRRLAFGFRLQHNSSFGRSILRCLRRDAEGCGRGRPRMQHRR